MSVCVFPKCDSVNISLRESRQTITGNMNMFEWFIAGGGWPLPFIGNSWTCVFWDRQRMSGLDDNINALIKDLPGSEDCVTTLAPTLYNFICLTVLLPYWPILIILWYSNKLTLKSEHSTLLLFRKGGLITFMGVLCTIKRLKKPETLHKYEHKENWYSTQKAVQLIQKNLVN